MIASDGKILDINRTALEILEYDKEQIIGKNLISTIYPSSVHDKAKELAMKCIKQHYLRNEELIIITNQGEIRNVLLSVAEVKDINKNLLYSILMQKDITNLKKIEENLRIGEEKYGN